MILKWICYFFFIFFLSDISFAGFLNNSFTVLPLSPALQKKVVDNKLWQPGCPVNISDLRLVTVKYYDYTNHVKNGEIILNKNAADSAAKAFEVLYDQKFPFAFISSLLDFTADSRAANEKNFTYGFICEKKHDHYTAKSSGNIITVNPVQNPKIEVVSYQLPVSFLCYYLPFFYGCHDNFKILSKIQIMPPQGMLSLNRSLNLKGMNEIAAPVFAQYGFSWSGLNTEKINFGKFIFNRR